MLDTYNQAIHEDVACTIRTNINTANHHFIMEKIDKVGTIHKGQSGVVYGQDGIAPTITTNKGDGQLIAEPVIIQRGHGYNSGGEFKEVAPTITGSTWHFNNVIKEPVVGALRGRNPENPNERGRSNGKYKQRLEINEKGTSNTITSVQKDNVVVEPIVLGWTRDSRGKIVDRHPVEVANCVTAAKRDNTQNYVVVPANTKEGEIKCELGGVVDIAYPTSTTRRGRVQEHGTVAPTLTCGCEGSLARIETPFRIRKLTERECFRLMGVRDEDSDKIRAAVSKSQCYKLAGNSIVVDVMVQIFDQLLFGNKNKNQQLEIF